MLKLFISMPMNGLSDDEIKANMAEAKAEAERIMGQPMELLETVFDFYEDVHPLVYLGESIKKMAEANVVYFHLGWKQARGCFVEHIAAVKYGKYIIGWGQESVKMDGGKTVWYDYDSESGDYELIGITPWKPLPEMPKEE